MKIEINFDDEGTSNKQSHDKFNKNTQLLGMLLYCGLCHAHLSLKKDSISNQNETAWECKNHANLINISEDVLLKKIIDDSMEVINKDSNLQKIETGKDVLTKYIQYASLEEVTKALFSLVEKINIYQKSIEIIYK